MTTLSDGASWLPKSRILFDLETVDQDRIVRGEPLSFSHDGRTVGKFDGKNLAGFALQDVVSVPIKNPCGEIGTDLFGSNLITRIGAVNQGVVVLKVDHGKVNQPVYLRRDGTNVCTDSPCYGWISVGTVIAVDDDDFCKVMLH